HGSRCSTAGTPRPKSAPTHSRTSSRASSRAQRGPDVLDARARGRFARNRGAVVGLAIVGALVLFAILAPMISSRDPYASEFVRGVTASETPVGPTATFPFGTDRLYRDVFIRIAYGARISLAIGFAATAIATLIGGAVGVIAGFYEGTRGRVLPISVDSV